MRALDYNITDLLYEPRDRIKGIIEDLSTADNDSSQQLLKDIDLVYTTIKHIYPTLIGTTNLAPHNLRFGIGNITERATIGVCEICATILRFFNERLPNEMDGKVGEYYADIIEHSLKKVLLYMGHSTRCVAQQQRTETLLDKSTGDTFML